MYGTPFLLKADPSLHTKTLNST